MIRYGMIVHKPTTEKEGGNGVSVGMMIRDMMSQPAEDIKTEDLMRAKVMMSTENANLAGLGGTPHLPEGAYVLYTEIDGIPHILGTCGRPFGAKNYIPPCSKEHDKNVSLGDMDENYGDDLKAPPGKKITSKYAKRCGAPDRFRSSDDPFCKENKTMDYT